MFVKLFQTDNQLDLASLVLRIGLGLVFFIGGWNKLYQLLDPALVENILASYYGPAGYVNAFFQTYLFEAGPVSGLITPWGFLTALSTFEFIAGVLLIAGLMVRPLSLIFGLLLWTFVMALPVITVEGAGADIATYRSPALLVQIRDIGLSGLMFTLFSLGAGKFSIEHEIFGGRKISRNINQNAVALLLRLSLAAPLMVGGLFSGYDHIQSFNTPGWLLIVVGLLTALGVKSKFTGSAIAVILLYFIFTKINIEVSMIANLNGFKRELAFLAGSMVFVLIGSGNKFKAQSMFSRLKPASG